MNKKRPTKKKPWRKKPTMIPVTTGWLEHIGGEIHSPSKSSFKTRNPAIPFLLVERLARGAVITPVFSLRQMKFGEPIPVLGRGDLLGTLRRFDAVFRNRLYIPRPVDAGKTNRST